VPSVVSSNCQPILRWLSANSRRLCISFGFPDLIIRDRNGKPYTVRYDAVNAMLLNEFLKEHRKVARQNYEMQQQKAMIAQLKKEMETMSARLKEQDSKIQKMSDRLELSEPRPEMVVNDR
jgi:septal ring factor EnvC (AmiA/AmiB activator)